MLSGRERKLVAAIVTLAVFAVGYGLIIEPVVSNWKMLSSEIEAKAQVLAKDMRLLKMYARLEAEYDKYRDFIATTKNEEEELAGALSEIESISKKANCHISNIKPRATKRIGNYKEVSFAVTAEGTVETLSRFLYSVETSRRLLKVGHFAMMPKSGAKGTLKATFHISKILVRE